MIIGIAGGSGAGKTYVTTYLKEKTRMSDIVVVTQDNFYKGLGDDDDPTTYDFDHPDSIDWDLFGECIQSLIDNKETDIPFYDFKLHKRDPEKTIHVKPSRVILVEGILIFTQQKIRDLLTYKIFVDADSDLRIMRRIQRDISERGRELDEIYHQYNTFVKKSYKMFINPSKQYADFILPNNEKNRFTGIDMIVNHIDLFSTFVLSPRNK